MYTYFVYTGECCSSNPRHHHSAFFRVVVHSSITAEQPWQNQASRTARSREIDTAHDSTRLSHGTLDRLARGQVARFSDHVLGTAYTPSYVYGIADTVAVDSMFD